MKMGEKAKRKRDASTEESIMNVFPDKQFINFIYPFNIIFHFQFAQQKV